MGNPYYQGPTTDHFDGTRFFNPGHPSTDRSLADLLRWRMRGHKENWPDSVPVRQTRPQQRVGSLVVTMVGHASLLIQVADLNITVDPVWSERASPVRFAGPKRLTAPGIAFEDLPSIDTVLITHSHYDHLDASTLSRLWTRDRPRIIAALGTDAIVTRTVPGTRPEAGDWGDTFALAPDVSVTLHSANHWSARSMRDRRMSLWCGFVLQARGTVIYVAGDTGYGDGSIFREVGERFGPPTLAILPLGAYEPRWFMRNQHVDPEEAVRIMLGCGARQALGVHWGTFQLTDEARLAPVTALADACDRLGVLPERFVAMEPGDVWPGSERLGANAEDP